MNLQGPLNLLRWIKDNEGSFAPPVSNRVVFTDSEFIFMVVHGPNARNDFHINPGDEIFYQLEGTIELEVRQGDAVERVELRQGELLLVPGGVPHAVHRPAATWGVVIERQRRPGELDEIVWYCDRCATVLQRRQLALRDIETELKAILDSFNRNSKARTCTNCKRVLPVARPSPA